MNFTKSKGMTTKIIVLFSLFMLFGYHQGLAEHTVTDHDSAKEEKCDTHKQKAMKIHINMYYELLAEKYAPDQVKIWQDIQKERATLKKQLNDAKEKGEILNLKEKMKPWFKEHKELESQFTDAIEKRDEKRIKKLLPEMIKHHERLNEIYKEILK